MTMISNNIESGRDCNPVAGDFGCVSAQLFSKRLGVDEKRGKQVLEWVLQNPTRDNRVHRAASPGGPAYIEDLEQYYEVVEGIGKNGKGIPSIPKQYRLTATMAAYHQAQVNAAKRELHKIHLERLQNRAERMVERSARASRGLNTDALKKRVRKLVKLQFAQPQMKRVLSCLSPSEWRRSAENRIGRGVLTSSTNYVQAQCDAALLNLGYPSGSLGIKTFVADLVSAIAHVIEGNDPIAKRISIAFKIMRWGKYQAEVNGISDLLARAYTFYNGVQPQSGSTPAWLEMLPPALAALGLGVVGNFLSSPSFKGLVTATGAFNGIVKASETICKAFKAFFEWAWLQFTGSPWTVDELQPLRDKLAHWVKRHQAARTTIAQASKLSNVSKERADLLTALFSFRRDYIADWMPLYDKLVSVEDKVVAANARNLGASLATLAAEIFEYLNPGGSREAPIPALFFGPPKCGKTIAIGLMANVLIHKGGVKCANFADQKWCFPRGVEYFNGYAGQYVTLMDDVFQIADPTQLTKETGFMFSACSPMPYNVPMADLSLKRSYYTSSYILATCNMPDSTLNAPQYTFGANLTKCVTSMEAMLSRFGDRDRKESFVFYVRPAGDLIRSGRLGSPDLTLEELDTNWEFVAYRPGKTRDGVDCLERCSDQENPDGRVYTFSQVVNLLDTARRAKSQLAEWDDPVNVGRLLSEPSATSSDVDRLAYQTITAHITAGGSLSSGTTAAVVQAFDRSLSAPAPSLGSEEGIRALRRSAALSPSSTPGSDGSDASRVVELDRVISAAGALTVQPQMFAKRIFSAVSERVWPKTPQSPTSPDGTSPREVIELDASLDAVPETIFGRLRSGIERFMDCARSQAQKELACGVTVGQAAAILAFAALGASVSVYFAKNRDVVFAQGYYPTEAKPRQQQPIHLVRGGMREVSMVPVVAQNAKLDDRRRYLTLEMVLGSDTFAVQCCLLHDRIGAVPFHFFSPLLRHDEDGDTTFDTELVGEIRITQGDKVYTLSTKDLRVIAVPNQDIAYVSFPDFPGFEPGKSMLGMLATRADHERRRNISTRGVVLRTWRSGGMALRDTQVHRAAQLGVTDYVVPGSGSVYLFRPNVYEYQLPVKFETTVGDCGSLYVSEGYAAAQTQIWAMHVAGRETRPNYTAYAVPLYKEDLEKVVDILKSDRSEVVAQSGSKSALHSLVLDKLANGTFKAGGLTTLKYSMPNKSAFHPSPLHPANNDVVASYMALQGYDAGLLAYLWRHPDGSLVVPRAIDKYGPTATAEVSDIFNAHRETVINGVVHEKCPPNEFHLPSFLKVSDAIVGVPGFLGAIPLGTSPGHPFSTGVVKPATGAGGKRGLLRVPGDGTYEFVGDKGSQPLALQLVLMFKTLFMVINAGLPSFDDLDAFQSAIAPFKEMFKYVVYPKDEVRPTPKADKSTRTIAAGAIHQQILSRVCTGKYQMSVRTNKTVCGDAFAVNFHNRLEVALLYNRMTKHPNHMNGDFSGYDRTVPRAASHIANCVIVEWIKLFASRKESFEADMSEFLDELRDIFSSVGEEFVEPRFNGVDLMVKMTQVFLAECEMPCYVAGDVWFVVDGSNPSGHPLTIERNGLINAVLHRTAFCEICPGLRYDDHVRNVFVGDDSWLSVSNEAAFFNQRSFADFCRRVGMEYTDAHKSSDIATFTPLEEVVICKRVIAKNRNFAAPLPEDVLWRAMFYFPNHKDNEVILSTFRSVLVELKHFPDEDRERFERVWVEAVREAGLAHELACARATLTPDVSGLF